MTYTSKTYAELRKIGGSLLKKIAGETSLIDAEIDVHKSKFAHVTIAMGTRTALATSGVDLATGSDATYYGVFVAPVDLTLVKMHDYLTEAYAKNTTDAKIEVYDDAGTPVKRFGRTLTAAGEDAKTFTSTNPESGVSAVTAGTRLDLKITATGGSGTGHAEVIIEYIENHA